MSKIKKCVHQLNRFIFINKEQKNKKIYLVYIPLELNSYIIITEFI